MRGGEIIELIGDLGSGKTTFTKGLAVGMGSKDPVQSPSFTIGNQYRADRLTMFHFDFYRLPEAGIMRQEITETLSDPQAVIVVEWGGIVADIFPKERISIHFSATGDTSREIYIRVPKSKQYLITF